MEKRTCCICGCHSEELNIITRNKKETVVCDACFNYILKDDYKKDIYPQYKTKNIKINCDNLPDIKGYYNDSKYEPMTKREIDDVINNCIKHLLSDQYLPKDTYHYGSGETLIIGEKYGDNIYIYITHGCEKIIIPIDDIEVIEK